jgi:hypothetical protein
VRYAATAGPHRARLNATFPAIAKHTEIKPPRSMPSIVALRPHRQRKCHATPYIMEFDNFIHPYLPAAVPVA